MNMLKQVYLYEIGDVTAQPAYGQPPGAVIVTQPMVTTTVVQQFRESPVQTVCPHCQAQIVTATQYETGTFTWLICAVVCLVGYVILRQKCFSVFTPQLILADG